MMEIEGHINSIMHALLQVALQIMVVPYKQLYLSYLMFCIMPSFLDTVALSMTSAKYFKMSVDKVLPNSYFTNVPFLGINSLVGFMVFI